MSLIRVCCTLAARLPDPTHRRRQIAIASTRWRSWRARVALSDLQSRMQSSDFGSILRYERFIVDDLVDNGLELNLFDACGELRDSGFKLAFRALIIPVCHLILHTLSVDLDSSTAIGDGLIVAITDTRASPDSEGCRIWVNFESRYGTCGLLDALRVSMTCRRGLQPHCERLRLTSASNPR